MSRRCALCRSYDTYYTLYISSKKLVRLSPERYPFPAYWISKASGEKQLGNVKMSNVGETEKFRTEHVSVICKRSQVQTGVGAESLR